MGTENVKESAIRTEDTDHEAEIAGNAPDQGVKKDQLGTEGEVTHLKRVVIQGGESFRSTGMFHLQDSNTLLLYR